MQEDIEEKTVRLAISSARLTGRVVLDGDKCILQLRGVRPFLSDKYDTVKLPEEEIPFP